MYTRHFWGLALDTGVYAETEAPRGARLSFITPLTPLTPLTYLATWPQRGHRIMLIHMRAGEKIKVRVTPAPVTELLDDLGHLPRLPGAPDAGSVETVRCHHPSVAYCLRSRCSHAGYRSVIPRSDSLGRSRRAAG